MLYTNNIFLNGRFCIKSEIADRSNGITVKYPAVAASRLAPLNITDIKSDSKYMSRSPSRSINIGFCSTKRETSIKK